MRRGTVLLAGIAACYAVYQEWRIAALWLIAATVFQLVAWDSRPRSPKGRSIRVSGNNNKVDVSSDDEV